MAKKAKKKPVKKSVKKAAVPAFEFGVSEFAKAAGVQATHARRILRDMGEKKAGKSYGWPTKEKMMAVIKRSERPTA